MVQFSATLATLDLWIRRCDRVPTLFWLWKGQERRGAQCWKRGYFNHQDKVCQIKCRQPLCGGRLKSNQATPHVLITEGPDFILWHAEECRMMCIRSKKLLPTLACMPFFPLTWEWSSCISCRFLLYCRSWFSPSGLNCESNKCSLCLCVRLCWGRGALWGTLDSQVTRLDNGFSPSF